MVKKAVIKILNLFGYKIVKISKYNKNKDVIEIQYQKKQESIETMYEEILNKIVNIFYGVISPKEALEYLFKLQEQINWHISNKCVDYYNGKHPKHHLWTCQYQFILDNIKNGDKVLDIGTGASLSYTQELAQKCKKIDCCDIREDLIKRSIDENSFENVHYRVLDITKEIPDEKYDVVIMSHILEHLENPEDVLRRVKQITKKIIVRLPRYDDHWMYLVKKDLGFFYFKDHDHKREYNLKEAVDLIESSGWKIEKALNDIDIKIVGII